jgi:hypothetical protein
MADILPIPSDACGCNACTPVVINLISGGGGSAELGGPYDPNDEGILPDNLDVFSTFNQTDATEESVIQIWKWNPTFQRWV